jgi:O-antigen/teichoic acid export membrane protein
MFPGLASGLLLGDAKYSALLGPVLLIVAANGLLGQLLYYFMGQLQIRMANTIQVLMGGLAPLLPLVVFAKLGLMRVLYFVGLLGLLGCVPFALDPIARCARQLKLREVFRRQTLTEAKQLLAYGLSRTPGFAAMAVLWSAVPLYLTRVHEPAAVTYVLAGIQTLLLTTIALSPISSVLLPRVADMKGTGATESLTRAMSMAHRLLLHMGLVLLPQVPVAVPSLVRAWLLIDTPEGFGVVTLVALAVPAFAAYSILRNPIDGVTHVPVNTYTVTGALGVQIALLWTLLHLGVAPSWAGGIALFVSFLVLGAATLICSVRLFEPRTARAADPALLGAIGMALGWLALGLAANALLAGQALWVKTAVLLAYEMVVFTVSFYAFVKLRAAWALEVASKMGALRHKRATAPFEPGVVEDTI